MDPILQRLAPMIRWMDQRLDRLILTLRPESLRAHVQRNTRGYLESILGIALATLFIALANRFIVIGNISLVYLLVVLYIATRYGRAPAILASVLAFLAYDFFFIPPTLRFTVDDPSEWLSLLTLLITALVISQLTATVRLRATEAMESRRQIAMLYEFAEVIAATTDRQDLLDTLAQHVLRYFAQMVSSPARSSCPTHWGGRAFRPARRLIILRSRHSTCKNVRWLRTRRTSCAPDRLSLRRSK